MALSKPLFSVYLQHQGFKGANGSEQVVPGFTILFTLYLPAFIAISFFREHGLHTWVRMRVTELRISEIVAAKLSVWAVIGIIQEAMLFLGGWLLLGLRVRGSVAGLSIVASLWILNMCALGIVLVAYCRTSNQVWGLGMTGSLVLAGLGGAIVPRAALPTWAAKISPAIPSYWAMRGYRSVLLESGRAWSIALPAAMLVGFGVTFLVVGMFRLRLDQPKEY